MTIAFKRDNNWAILCAWKCNCATATHFCNSICSHRGGERDRERASVTESWLKSERPDEWTSDDSGLRCSVHVEHTFIAKSRIHRRKPMASTKLVLFFQLCSFLTLPLVRVLCLFRFCFMQIIWWNGIFVEHFMHCLFSQLSLQGLFYARLMWNMHIASEQMNGSTGANGSNGGDGGGNSEKNNKS